jgi:hypothetical protein
MLKRQERVNTTILTAGRNKLQSIPVTKQKQLNKPKPTTKQTVYPQIIEC